MKCDWGIGKKEVSFILLGLVSGGASGFFGGGGGSLLVPGLTGRCGLEPKCALATSLAVMAPVCAVGGAVYALRVGVDLSQFLPYGLGGLAGGFIGGRLLGRLSPGPVMRLFGGLLLVAGVKLLWVG